MRAVRSPVRHLMPPRSRFLGLIAVVTGLLACSPAGTSTGPSLGVASSAPSTVASLPPVATPALTGLTGHIIFARAGGTYEDETSFVAKIDGTGEVQLGELGKSGGPSALRDGSRISVGAEAPDQRFTAAISNLDGSMRVLVPLPSGTLNMPGGLFTPDGKRLVREGFSDSDPSLHAVYLTGIDGGKLARLTKTAFIPGDVSPDGKQLVMFTGPDAPTPPPGQLWVINLDGSGLRQLTPDSVEVGCCFNYRYSPDGSKILFATANDGALWTISTDGSGLKKIFQDSEGRFAITPTWSPEGSMILFALDPSSDPFEHPNNAFYVVRADGSDLTLVLGGDDFKREPIWVSR
jgi:hypothetical protein